LEPIVTQHNVRYGGPSSSEDYNNTNRDMYIDLLRLYNNIGNSEEKLREAVNMLLLENLFLQRKIDELQSEIYNLLDQVAQLPSRTFKLLPSSMMTSHEGYTNVLSPASIDREYMLVTLPVAANAVSKTHLTNYTTGEIFVPSSLRVNIYPSEENYIENNITKAFDGNNAAYWQRSVTYGGSVSETECLLEINLPTNISSSLYVNSIIFRPFPENSMDIMAIYYNSTDNPKNITFSETSKDSHADIVSKGWSLIPGFPVDENEEPIPVLEAQRTKWCFSDTAMTKVVIRLRQRNWVEENGERVFIFGAKEIDVRYENYNRTGGYFLTPFSPILNAGETSYSITRIRHHFANNNALSSDGAFNEFTNTSNCLTYEVFEENEGGVLESREGNLNNITSPICWIATTLYPDPNYNSTPALDYIEVIYTVQ
jgi:hypothetical protein